MVLKLCLQLRLSKVAFGAETTYTNKMLEKRSKRKEDHQERMYRSFTSLDLSVLLSKTANGSSSVVGVL